MPDRILREGRLLGNYRLQNLLGQGGFAEVYLAEHIHLKTLVAIKLLHAHLDATHMQKFRREARLVASLRHPHIITITDFGVQDEVPYLVMDYAPGGTLRQQVPKGSRLAPARVLEYLTPIGEALDFAHNEQVVHRDVKPENMLLGQRNEILLSDFGIATVVDRFQQATPTVAGTASYMAPEQLRGRPQPASDQYALAVVAYEWLCGTRPFRGTFAEVMSQHLQNDPPPLTSLNPAIPQALEEVILIALSKSPAQRFPSLGDFLHDFALTLRPSRRVSSPPPTQRNTRPASPPIPTSQTRSAQPRIKPPIPEPTVIKQLDRTQTGTSRRTILATLGGLALLGSGGTAWWLYTHQSRTTRSQSPGIVAPGSTLGPSINTNQTSTSTFTSFGTLYNHHAFANQLSSTAWFPDRNQTLIAAGCYDNTAQIWNVNTTKIISCQGHTDIVSSVTWSPDGKYIASASYDKTIRIWDATNGTLIFPCVGHTARVSAVTWSPDGMYIASGSADHNVMIWNASNGSLLSTYTGHSDWVSTVAWSPDGTLIASGSHDATVQVWSPITKKVTYTFSNTGIVIYTLAWSPNSSYIASGNFQGSVDVWNALNGSNHFTYTQHSDSVLAVAWSHDGKKIASGSADNTVRVWDASDGSNSSNYRGHKGAVDALSWSPDSARLASGSADKVLQIWQAI